MSVSRSNAGAAPGVAICGFARTAFTPAAKGGFADVRPDDMLGALLKESKARFLPEDTWPEDVLVGCAFPEGEQGLNVARAGVFLADFPESVPGVTVNRFCGSSLSAAHMAASHIMAGTGDVFLAAGVESMSRVPMGGFTPMPNPRLYASYPEVYASMGETAENLATRYRIAREEQERFALSSHAKAAAAAENLNEIVHVAGVEHDGCVRPHSTAEDLASLPPAFAAQGTVTAATSAPLTDGAACVVLCSDRFAAERKLPVWARIRTFAVSGCAPGMMGIGPVSAVRKALDRTGVTPEEIDVVELNEAFAAQALAVLQELPFAPEKVNVEGGALAIGHPLGASGARILGKAASLLHRRGGRFALATMCVGGGQGVAAILESAA